MKTGTIINRTLAQLNKQANKQGAESLHYDFRAYRIELAYWTSPWVYTILNKQR